MMKKAYYALLLATATFAQVNAVTISDFLPDMSEIDNDAVVAIEGFKSAQDLYRLYQHSQEKGKNPYAENSLPYDLLSKIPFLGIWLAAPFKTPLNLHNLKTDDLENLTYTILKRIAVRVVATYISIRGFDALNDLAYDHFTTTYEKILSVVPANMRPVVRRITPAIIKEAIIIYLDDAGISAPSASVPSQI